MGLWRLGKTHLGWKPSWSEVGDVLVWVGISSVLSLLWFSLPVRLAIAFRQESWHAEVQVKLHFLFIHLKKRVDLTELIKMAAEHMLKRWQSTGEPVTIPVQKTVRRLPRAVVSHAVGRPVRFLARHARCQKAAVHVQVGGTNAMESALLAGATWTLAGIAIAQFSRFVQLSPKRPEVNVVPHFANRALRIHLDCILTFRLGYAMLTIIWLLSRLLREREFRAWARDSWRRKGVVASGRASDSGSYEDGHGKP